jgi:hypothetical protein
MWNSVIESPGRANVPADRARRSALQFAIQG